MAFRDGIVHLHRHFEGLNTLGVVLSTALHKHHHARTQFQGLSPPRSPGCKPSLLRRCTRQYSGGDRATASASEVGDAPIFLQAVRDLEESMRSSGR